MANGCWFLGRSAITRPVPQQQQETLSSNVQLPQVEQPLLFAASILQQEAPVEVDEPVQKEADEVVVEQLEEACEVVTEEEAPILSKSDPELFPDFFEAALSSRLYQLSKAKSRCRLFNYTTQEAGSTQNCTQA